MNTQALFWAGLVFVIQSLFWLSFLSDFPKKIMVKIREALAKFLFSHQGWVNFNKKRGVRISWNGKYNFLTRRYDLPAWCFVTTKHIIAKISHHNETHKNQIVFVNEIHSGCMGDHATVFLANGTELVVDENTLVPASILQTFFFSKLALYKRLINQVSP